MELQTSSRYGSGDDASLRSAAALIAVIISSFPHIDRSRLLREARTLETQEVVSVPPIWMGVPATGDPKLRAAVVAGHALTLLAVSKAGPDDTVRRVLDIARSSATGAPYIGDPTEPLDSDASIATAKVMMAASQHDPEIAHALNGDPALAALVGDVALAYDCADHDTVLGGGFLDFLKKRKPKPGSAKPSTNSSASKPDKRPTIFKPFSTAVQRAAAAGTGAALVSLAKTVSPESVPAPSPSTPPLAVPAADATARAVITAPPTVSVTNDGRLVEANSQLPLATQPNGDMTGQTNPIAVPPVTLTNGTNPNVGIIPGVATSLASVDARAKVEAAIREMKAITTSMREQRSKMEASARDLARLTWASSVLDASDPASELLLLVQPDFSNTKTALKTLWDGITAARQSGDSSVVASLVSAVKSSIGSLDPSSLSKILTGDPDPFGDGAHDGDSASTAFQGAVDQYLDDPAHTERVMEGDPGDEGVDAIVREAYGSGDPESLDYPEPAYSGDALGEEGEILED